ncbi:serine palmitoyltransferase component [Dispira simplex]|nr:serine palmitoyltransferase component [Dispira simplex]
MDPLTVTPPAASTWTWAWTQFTQTVALIPGSKIVGRYIRNSYQNDPFRIVLEVCLLLFVVWYLLEKRYRIDHHEITLSKQEVDELIEDWQPEPLVPALSEWEREQMEETPILVSEQGPRPRVEGVSQPVLNLVSYNFLGLAGVNDLKEHAVHTLRKYGVGACGPPGFYGTLDVHKDLEKKLAEFIGSEEAIIYSQGLTTTLSVIPCFAKRGDILICDEGINFSVQKSIQISRSQIRYFKHNDMKDLERILKEIEQEDQATKRVVTRRFIVVEGLYVNTGDIVPLPDLLALKKRYKYRLILDESYSFGVLGSQGRGVTEHFQIPADEVDLLIGSMCNSLASSGGFCAGRRELMEHQRLSGLGYVFSASLPAILAVYAVDSLDILASDQGKTAIRNLRDISRQMHQGLQALVNTGALTVTGGTNQSPILHIRFDRAWVQKALPLPSGIQLPANPRRPLPDPIRVELEKLLQEVVRGALTRHILLGRARYVVDQERLVPDPSIRICVTAAHSKEEVQEAAQVICEAFRKVLKPYL